MTDGIVWIVTLFLVFGGVRFMNEQLNHRRQRRREIDQRNREIERGPDPICGCGHHFSFHNGQTGLCMQTGRVETKWDEWGDASKWEMKQCGCQRYVGPQPLSSLYAPEFTSDIVEIAREEEK